VAERIPDRRSWSGESSGTAYPYLNLLAGATSLRRACWQSRSYLSTAVSLVFGFRFGVSGRGSYAFFAFVTALWNPLPDWQEGAHQRHQQKDLENRRNPKPAGENAMMFHQSRPAGAQPAVKHAFAPEPRRTGIDAPLDLIIVDEAPLRQVEIPAPSLSEQQTKQTALDPEVTQRADP